MRCRRSLARVSLTIAGAVAHTALAAAAFGCDVFDESRLGPQLSRADSGVSAPVAGDAGRAGVSGGASTAGAGGGAGSAASGGGASSPLDAGASDAGDLHDGAVTPPACAPAQVEDHCARIPLLDAPPVIDGEIDCGAQLVPLPPAGWNGVQPMPEEHHTQLAAAIRPDGLYLYVEVQSGEAPRPHPPGSYIDCGDAVEIYVDADALIDPHGKYSTPGTMQFIIAAPSPAAPVAIEALRFVAGQNQGAWSSPNVRTRLLATGYAVEAFITAADLDLTAWMPSERIGFDIAIDVGAPAETPDLVCGLQLGQYFLRTGERDDDADGGICGGKPWCDTRAFCTPKI
jgi:hypothetical protein